jgi:hypothetical protein
MRRVLSIGMTTRLSREGSRADLKLKTKTRLPPEHFLLYFPTELIVDALRRLSGAPV